MPPQNSSCSRLVATLKRTAKKNSSCVVWSKKYGRWLVVLLNVTGYLRDTKITCTCVVRVNCLTGCGKKNGFVFLGVEMGVTREGRGRISSCKVCVWEGEANWQEVRAAHVPTLLKTANPNYRTRILIHNLVHLVPRPFQIEIFWDLGMRLGLIHLDSDFVH